MPAVHNIAQTPHKFFSQLNTEEQNYKIRLLKLRYADKQSIDTILQNAEDIIMLVKLAELVPTIETWCLDKTMEPYWDLQWSKMAERHHPEHVKLLPQRFISSFSLVRGRKWFDQAIQLVNNGVPADGEKVLSFLEKSKNYHCIAALAAITNNFKNRLEKATKNDFMKNDTMLLEEVNKYREFLESSTRIHGQVAFMLLVKLMICLSNYYGQTKQNREVINLQIIKYLHAASGCSLHSKTAVHNAIHCSSLTSDMLDPALTLKQIEKMQKQLEHALPNSVSIAIAAGFKLSREFNETSQSYEINRNNEESEPTNDGSLPTLDCA